jgi:Ring finger domain
MPLSTATRQNTAANSQESTATAAVRASIRNRRKRQTHRTRRPSSLDLVAQEIETVIFGESDDEDESDGDGDDQSSMEDAENDSVCLNSEGHESDGLNFRRRGGRNAFKRNRIDPIHYSSLDSEEINSYGLFDDPQEQRRGRRSKAGRSAPGAIIYAKRYQSPGTLFVPILVFLSATFAALLVIRVIMSLLTAAVGMVILILLAIRFVQEFVTRPIRLIRNLHASPVVCFASLGAVVGAIHALWVQGLFPLSMLIMTASTSRFPENLRNSLRDWFQLDEATSNCDSDGINVDLIMLWGLLRGLGYGIEIGSLWLILFGKSTNSTALSRHIYRRIWKPLKRQYRHSARITERQTNDDSTPVANRASTSMYQLDDDNDRGSDRHLCSICLERLGDDPTDSSVGEVGVDIKFSSIPDRYQLLPCNHSFHRECARHWLTIQKTCPVCRRDVKGMRGCGSNKSARDAT